MLCSLTKRSDEQTGHRASSDSTAATREPLQLDVLRQNLRHVDIKSKVSVLVGGLCEPFCVSIWPNPDNSGIGLTVSTCGMLVRLLYTQVLHKTTYNDAQCS